MQAIALVNLQNISELQNLWGNVDIKSCMTQNGGHTCLAIDKAHGTYKIGANSGRVTTAITNGSGQFEIGLLML